MNVRELAEAEGLKSFDTALPLAWYEDVHAKTNIWPQEVGFVWSYDNGSVWGNPYPLTDKAKEVLAHYNNIPIDEAGFCDNCAQPYHVAERNVTDAPPGIIRCGECGLCSICCKHPMVEI